MEEVFKLKGVEVGGVYSTNNYGDFVVERFTRGRNEEDSGRVYVDINFVTTGTKKSVRLDKIHSGSIKDNYYPKRYNVGYLGETTYEENKIAYKVWNHMLSRCYNVKDKSYPTYGGIGVTVDSAWWDYEVFLRYYEENCIEGFHLDKDLFSVSSSKVYSKNTCCFIPQSLNNALKVCDNDGIIKCRLQWRYGGVKGVDSLPYKHFPTKSMAYSYRSECFKYRLEKLLEEYSKVLPIKVLNAATKVLQEEAEKIG